MFYLFWGLLNIALFIFFIRICFRATQLVKEKIGLLASVVFVFGLLFIGCSNNSTADQYKTWTFTSNDNVNQNSDFSIPVILEKNLTSTYNLYINCAKDQHQNNIPESAQSSVTGFIAGTNWKPLNVTVNRINNDKFQYSITGIVEWRLLGAKLYTQFKSYDGIAYTDDFKNPY